MRKEYQAIVDKVWDQVGPDMYSKLQLVAERCQAFADQPPKMLTDEEINKVLRSLPYWVTPSISLTETARAIIAAHIAKQRTPETRKVKLWERNSSKGLFIAVNDDTKFADCKIVKEFEL